MRILPDMHLPKFVAATEIPQETLALSVSSKQISWDAERVLDMPSNEILLIRSGHSITNMLISPGTDLAMTISASETSSISTQVSVTKKLTRSTTEFKTVMCAMEIPLATLKMSITIC
jgi:hypothetical protein